MKTVKEIEYKHFGKCIKITNGLIDMVITLNMGPRVVYFGYCGEKNEFYEDQVFDKNQPTDDVFSVFGNKGVWHLFGGHRLWAAPESMPRTYYPDNEGVTYKTKDKKIVVLQNPQSWTNIRLSIEIEMDDKEPRVQITHKIKNTGAWSCELAPWAITAMAGGGTLILPRPEGGDELLPNMFLALWPYSALNDKRFSMGEKYILLKQNYITQKFKFGLSGIRHAAYVNDQTMFIKAYDVNKNGRYPDGGMSFEGFTNENYLEMESLGELSVIPPGGIISHTEHWKLVKYVEYGDINDQTAHELFKKHVL